MRNFSKSALFAVPAIAIAGLASADVITPASISFVGTAAETFTNETNLINGTGLSAPLAVDESNLATVTHSSVSSGNAWVTTAPNGSPADYFAPAGGTVVFDIDLGSTHTVDSFTSWGYNFSVYGGNMISDITLAFSADGGATFGSSQTISVPLAATPQSSVTIALAETTANFIELTVNDNHFGAIDPNDSELVITGGDRIGLAEIVFTNNVPEPGSLALLGLGGLLMVRRRRG